MRFLGNILCYPMHAVQRLYCRQQLVIKTHPVPQCEVSSSLHEHMALEPSLFVPSEELVVGLARQLGSRPYAPHVSETLLRKCAAKERLDVAWRGEEKVRHWHNFSEKKPQ
jgi:hypothetical protein